MALPSAPLADIIMRCDVVTRAHIAASCTALLHALLGCEGVHLKLDVTSVNLVRYGWKLRLASCPLVGMVQSVPENIAPGTGK